MGVLGLLQEKRSSEAGHLRPETAVVGGCRCHYMVQALLPVGSLSCTPSPGLWPILGRAEAPQVSPRPLQRLRPTTPPCGYAWPDIPGPWGSWEQGQRGPVQFVQPASPSPS